MKVLDVRSRIYTFPGNVGGTAFETNAGTLIRVSAADGTARIYRSTDGGGSWSLRASMTIPAGFTSTKGQFIDSRGYLYVGGSTQTTYEDLTRRAQLWQSKDDGITWALVCTAESSAFWHFAEDTLGRVYVNEYSLTPSTGTEYPAVNIWRSDTSGNNFTKWHTAVKESAPGVRDGVRHIHTVHVDAFDRVFCCYGDSGWGGDATKIVRLDASGVKDIDYGIQGNGTTSLIHTATGVILAGDDSDRRGISALNPVAALSCVQRQWISVLGARYDSYGFDMLRDYDNNILTLHTPPSITRVPFISLSQDDGRTWIPVIFTSLGQAGSNTMSLNKTLPNGKIFLSGGVIKYFSRPTLKELKHTQLFVRMP